MFESFTLIPQTDSESTAMMAPINDIVNELRNIVPSEKWRCNWNGDYWNMSLGYLLTILNALSDDIEKYNVDYFDGNQYRFKSRFGNDSNNAGIIINNEASTHFDPNEYRGAVYLEQAQELLKQNPRHFIKVFTNSNTEYLFIWTNKALDPISIYKVFSLEMALHKRNNPVADKFLNALLENNITTAKQVLIDFFNSDEVAKIKYKKFSACLKSTKNKKLENLENQITICRTSIENYEKEIVNYASRIREYSENIAFLKSMNDEEEHLLFYKHLKKIPYITSFKGENDGHIDIEYQAPLIYFADFPIEKMINQSYRTSKEITLLKIFLGRKYELWTRAKLRFWTHNFDVDLLRSDSSIPLFPHPHIDMFGCFGNHRQGIHQSAESGDYIGAIEQLSQAVLNVNFYDSCVINEMLKELNRKWTTLKTWKCKETGEMLTTAEVVERGDYYEET